MNALHYAKRIVYGSEETLMFTYNEAVRLKDSPGIWCECGTAAGAHIIVMALASSTKRIYAFDSFEGISLPSNRDNQLPGIRMLQEWEQRALPDPGKQVLESSGATVVSLDDFWDNVYSAFGIKYTDEKPFDIVAVKGWFENTMPIYGPLIEPISLLRLDGDLYNSTWVCLQHLFPRVIKGGCLIIDDINLPGCRDAVTEYFQLINYEPVFHYISDIAYLYK